MLQLVVISADQAVSKEFLYYAKRLKLDRQLAYVFLDKCYIAITDTLYQQQLQQLYQLCYCYYLLICLIAMLIVKLKLVLQANLLLPKAMLFCQSIMQPIMQYIVLTTNKALFEFAKALILILLLLLGQHKIIYICSYATSNLLSSML